MTPTRFLMLLALVATLAATAARSAAEAPQGFLDGVFDGRLSGWALDPANPAEPTTVSVYLDAPNGSGRLMASFPTDKLRPDINQRFATTGAHGYSWPIPAAYRQQLHLWYVYADRPDGSSTLLAQSPRLHPAVTAAGEQAPETVFRYATQKCEPLDIPDHPARAWRDADGEVNLVASHYIVRRAVGKTLDSVVHQCAVVHAPDNDMGFGDFRYHEWLMAPYTLDGRTVFALMHDEWYGALVDAACHHDLLDSWISAIVLAVSNDGGARFTLPADYVVRRPLTPWSNSFPCSKSDATVYGDLGGSNIFSKDGYFYKYFVYWPEPGVLPRRFRECAMRTQHLGDPSSWEIWTGTGYRRSRTAPCAAVPGLRDARSVTFNAYLGLYVAAEYAPERGFFFSVSKDLMNWSEPIPIATPGIDTSKTPYPSLLDPDDTSRNFEKTGQTPYLYYTQLHGGLNNDLMRLRIRFAVEGRTN